MLTGRFIKAKDLLLKVVSDDKENIDSLYHMGLLYELLNNYELASKYYKLVLSVKQDYKPALEHLEKLIEK